MQITWWSIFAISVVIFTTLIGFVFPKLFFKVGFQMPFSSDRGLRNYKEKDGRSIVYAPNTNYKKFVHQYILSDRNGKKAMLCKIDKSVAYLDYNIYIFDKNDKVFRVMSVKDYIENPGYTAQVELPSETNYISLVLNYADNIKFSDAVIIKMSNRRMELFALSVGLLVILETFFIKFCIANLYGDVFGQYFLISIKHIFITLGAGLVSAFFSWFVAIIYFKNKSLKYGGI